MATVKSKAFLSINPTTVQSLRTDRITALYLGCKTTDLPNFPKPIWLPIYRMSWDDEDNFYYSYTKGFQDNYEQLKKHLINPNFGLNQIWITKHLDSRFSSRIPRRARSMKQYDWLGIGNIKDDYIAYLARCGGKRAGDSHHIFPEVQAKSDYYSFYFHNMVLNDKIANLDNLPQASAKSILSSDCEKSYILYEDKVIAECPEYIHYLINSDIYQKHQINIEQINYTNADTSKIIVINLKIKFSSNPWWQREFQPVNSMLV